MLLPFTSVLRRLALEGRAVLAEATGLVVPADWPNPNFAEVLPRIAWQPETDDWVFLVVEDGRVVGEIGAKLPPDAEGAVEVGYGIVASARRRGYAASALGGFVALCRERGVRRVRAECLVHNPGSIRVLEHNGFLRVGHGVDDDGELILWERSTGV